MISQRAAKLLWDVQQAAQRIDRFATDRTFEAFVTDDMLRSAIERQFGIIGEAFTVLRRTAPEVAAEIPDLHRIIGFRNVLIHVYDRVNPAEVWGTIENHLEALQRTVERLLRDVAGEASP